MLVSKIKNGVGILLGSAGLTAILIYLVGEILESGSITALIQKSLYEEPLHHNIFLLFGAAPASMAVGYFYQKLKNLQLNLEQTVEERTEHLRESEEKYRFIFEDSPDGIIILDPMGNITSVNDVVLSYGYKREELIGKSWLEFIPEKRRPMLDKHVADVTMGTSTQGEFELNIPRGRLPVWFRGSPIKKRGEIVGFQIILIDITEKKKMEEEFRESEERHKNLYESVPDALAVYVGREGHLIEYNKAFKKWSGYADEELKDKVFLDFVHPDDRALVLERYRTEYSEEELPLVYEIKGLNKKGEIIPTEISVGTYKKKGRVVGINVMHRDITERKAMERKLQEYADHLEEMVEERTKELKESQERLLKSERLAAIGQLATMVGHDLRNPLSAIQNACYYLKMKLGSSKDEKIKKMFGIIDKEINYANSIVKDLLDFSRVKKPDLKKIDLISSIQDAIAQLKFPENVTLTTKFTEVPAIEADPDQLRRVFQNIALNGAQAMPDAGELTVSTRKNDDFVEVAFTDTGVGIPEKNMDKLFTPLFTTKSQGVGLGLAICKNLVEGHNGRIEVKSKVGKGSTFTVKLPIHQTEGGEKQT